ncbi:hypothetical protein [Ruminococcus flavefaciens]|uniref:GyrI-like small molecule binding domain-containing protein n=1 Tax=Ruminococcus flavefaciens TaxID=1265 RepID=A0A315XX43_RUMFL|nr:hypothetical protein [Ruminococcus flavefaciens]PWJ11797.1 hypothetical protein IE37_02059 [Ruminococcus flavefaciens]SSA49984.1 hypothetical protein SAMN02910325_02059 [Ruminococcus flavefaciens]
MQILKNQMLSRNNLVICRKNVENADIFKFIRYASDNIHALDLEVNDNIIFTRHSLENQQITEMMIPVRGEISHFGGFEYKPCFKLINAVTIRHEGGIGKIGSTEKKLTDYISECHLEPVTAPYYVVVRGDEKSAEDCIIDIYIGINYNIL